MAKKEEHADNVGGMKVGHGSIPKFLYPVYIGLFIWAFYYVLIDSPTISYSRPAEPQTDAKLVISQKCSACHIIDGKGGAVGPALDQVGARMDRAALEKFINDPGSRNANSAANMGASFKMLKDSEKTAIVDYLANKK
ncbi:c-type cytochrome [Heliophilum fasciatum]|uniref:Cytochrome c n=1 Tax=Heliophilum fasciatum TaxID=35700 RepID=A0A4V2SWE3_9FIRM|nr:cytochrome c [Heliophilum fasciatum]MCW2278913.1 mono/diheme cytochrome c family protein [Heliophilum fasciatum]TCP62046.1 cytochrome c [Heliophilum fasciatum]